MHDFMLLQVIAKYLNIAASLKKIYLLGSTQQYVTVYLRQFWPNYDSQWDVHVLQFTPGGWGMALIYLFDLKFLI